LNRKRLAGTALGIVLLGALWTLLAPTTLGGSLLYVSPSGVSMLPGIRNGDLALVRPGGTYRAGDVVAYRNRLLRHVVLHRILGVRSDGRYLMKGDSNDFIDPAPATREEILGRLWINVPHGRTVLAWPFRPLNSGLLAGGFLLLSGLGLRRRQRRQVRGEPPPLEPGRAGSLAGGLLLGAFAGLLLLGALLAAVAFTHAPNHQVRRTLSYTQAGRFAYLAEVHDPPAAIGPVATTGEPIFTRLSDAVGVTFAYRFSSSAPAALAGSAELSLRLRDATGWTKTLPLSPAHPFAGPSTLLDGQFSLRQLQHVVSGLNAATGVPHSNVFVDVLPRIIVRGRLSTAKVATSFRPALSFSLDELSLTRLDAGGPGSTAALAPSMIGRVDVAGRATTYVQLARLQVKVALLRKLAVSLGLVGFLGLLAVGLGELRRSRRGEVDRIRARHGSRILSVVSLEQGSWQEVVEVQSFEALVRVSDQYQRMILHSIVDGWNRFSVSDGGIAYV